MMSDQKKSAVSQAQRDSPIRQILPSILYVTRYWKENFKNDLEFAIDKTTEYQSNTQPGNQDNY